ncbi:MAG: hypothetical protein KGJ57_21190 [Sphingomonadales bacterium]|nr:hypothetical protein [Sphingomonadales bacterium]MDE2171912.1 hypothetical protein [Sphingomonadales bacterium]
MIRNETTGDAVRRRGCVLDIETAPDRHASILAQRSKGAPTGSPLHEIVNVSVLEFVALPDGTLGEWMLNSYHRTEYAEADILANAEKALAATVEDGGIIATFNGRQFDLPMLRMRQLRWWQCAADAIPRIWAEEAEHLDLMIELSGHGLGRWPSLADACASLGFSLRGPARVGGGRTIPPETEKCELDVVGTAILLHYVLAGRRFSDEPLRRGLPAFGRFVRALAERKSHLERFALSHLLMDDAGAWGATATCSASPPARTGT